MLSFLVFSARGRDLRSHFSALSKEPWLRLVTRLPKSGRFLHWNNMGEVVVRENMIMTNILCPGSREVCNLDQLIVIPDVND